MAGGGGGGVLGVTRGPGIRGCSGGAWWGWGAGVGRGRRARGGRGGGWGEGGLRGGWVWAGVGVWGGGGGGGEGGGGVLEGVVGHVTGSGGGQLSELFDADGPQNAGGLTASARSVAEVLRAYA